MLNSNLVSEPCKQFWCCYKLDHIDENTIFDTVNSTPEFIQVSRRRYIQVYITYLSGENFNAVVAIMIKMWDVATSNQGGRDLVSFIGTMNTFP